MGKQKPEIDNAGRKDDGEFMTPELVRQIVYGTIRIAVVAIAGGVAKGLFDQFSIDQITGGLTVVALATFAGYSKWAIAKKAAVKVESLQTVVATKTAETQVLRAVVADSHAETDALIDSLIEAKVPIPELPPIKPASIEELAAALHAEKSQ